MKKGLLVLCSVVSLALTSFGWARAPHGAPDVQRLANRLELDQTQAEQVSEILQEQGAKRQEIRGQIRAEMQALHQETLERLRPVLSPEQLQKFMQLSEARRDRHKGHNAKPMAPAPAQ